MRRLYNAIGFRLRNAIRFRRPGVTFPNESKNALFEHANVERRPLLVQRERELRERYDLGALFSKSSRYIYRDNIYWLDGLEKCFAGQEARVQDIVKVVDIGSNSFHYAFALSRFAAAHFGSSKVNLTGYEIDGHVVYADLRSRADYAEAYLAQLQSDSAHYVAADFVAAQVSGIDMATLFFPFLTEEPLLWWGLPQALFSPRALVMRAIECVKPGGTLVVWNQTDEEVSKLDELVRGVTLMSRVRLASDLVDYEGETIDRVGSVFRRDS